MGEKIEKVELMSLLSSRENDHDDDDMFARRSWLKRAVVIIQEETIGGLG